MKGGDGEGWVRAGMRVGGWDDGKSWRGDGKVGTWMWVGMVR